MADSVNIFNPFWTFFFIFFLLYNIFFLFHHFSFYSPEKKAIPFKPQKLTKAPKQGPMIARTTDELPIPKGIPLLANSPDEIPKNIPGQRMPATAYQVEN